MSRPVRARAVARGNQRTGPSVIRVDQPPWLHVHGLEALALQDATCEIPAHHCLHVRDCRLLPERALQRCACGLATRDRLQLHCGAGEDGTASRERLPRLERRLPLLLLLFGAQSRLLRMAAGAGRSGPS